jgi:hypothetical protein
MVFIKSQYTITNLMSYFDCSSMLVCSKRQADAIYFSSIFDPALHTVYLHTLGGPEDGYVSLLHSYIIL